MAGTARLYCLLVAIIAGGGDPAHSIVATKHESYTSLAAKRSPLRLFSLQIEEEEAIGMVLVVPQTRPR